MDKSFLISTALTAVTSGIAVWALFKWHEIRNRLDQLTDKYNTERSIQESLMHQYGSHEFFPLLKDLIPDKCKGYQLRLANLCNNMCLKYKVPTIRILDVGSATGGQSFQLSKHFKEVVGTDTCYSMLVSSQQMKQFAEVTGLFPCEGGLRTIPFKARIQDDSNRERVTFWDEDVCALVHTAGIFNCVLVSNTLRDLGKPKQFLSDIGDYVLTGGILIIADSYDWESGPEKELDDLTSTFESLNVLLFPKWTLLEERNLPFFTVQCERSAQISNAHVTIWKRNPDELK